MSEQLTFRSNFVWGAATASYQIEGSPLADGAGASIWHRFAHTPGNIANADTGDVACDHYNRYKEDVDLMRTIGLNAYRFSVAWPRVLPEGRGVVNEAGLDFYDRLTDELCGAGIEPFVTMYHWDLPAALQDAGGWANRDCAMWFADYASVLFERLGDRVGHWITLNEPWASSHLGYISGVHAPGMKDVWAGLRAVHHHALGHGNAVQAFRASGAQGEIGITLVTAAIRAASEDEADVAARERQHAFLNRLFLDPIYTGAYPDVLVQWFGDAWPETPQSDLQIISSPIDFLGVNYYFPSYAIAAPGEGLLHASAAEREVPKTQMGWEIDPTGLFDVLTWINQTYGGPPMYITENGAAFEDVVDAAGDIDDADRLAYIEGHLREAHRAIAGGVDLRGYFVWSLMDNFEWARGYELRFGVVRVDYETLERTIKRSGRWYRDVISAGLLG